MKLFNKISTKISIVLKIIDTPTKNITEKVDIFFYFVMLRVQRIKINSLLYSSIFFNSDRKCQLKLLY